MANTRLPNNIHNLRGTHRKDRHGPKDEEPLLELIYPDIPDGLDERAIKVWLEIKKVMEPANVYSEADSGSLTAYCELEGMKRSDPTAFPATMWSQLRLHRKDLYLDPESRAKVGGKKGEQANPFGRF